MAKLTSGTAWEATQSQTSQDATYTFATSNKYVNKDIIFKINVPGIVLKKPTTNGDYTTFTIQAEGDDTVFTVKLDYYGNMWVE